jgi:hypothetical protein
MPSFEDRAVSAAPVEAVWKLLYDPSRFPEWLDGVGSVELGPRDGEGDYTMFPEGYPDFPMPQAMHTGDRTVVISCLVSDLEFSWRLEPLDDDGTEIVVHVEIPEQEAHRLDTQRAAIGASVRRLATLASGDPAA